MLRQLQRLGTDTAIYGVSTILGRMLNFLLLPFYTNVLLPGEYGIVSYLFSIIAFVNVFYSYGMESAYFKYSSSGEIGTARENFSTPLLSLVTTSGIFSIVILLFTPQLTGALAISGNLGSLVACSAGVLAFDAIAIIPFAALRMEHRPRVFATIKFLTILITVVLNIILLVVVRMGVEGIFLSNLIASFSSVAMLLPTIRRNFIFSVNRDLLRALLRFGLPFVPAGLATMAIQVIDRPILRGLTDDATVGIYQANYRLGIFMMLVVQMYDFAWRPFYFSNANEPNAKQLFARVLTYFFLFMSSVFLVVSFFIPDLVNVNLFGRHLIHPDYWSGLNIVPIVLAGYVFLGISNNLSAGVYLQKKTSYMPPITFLGAGINIAANLWLIPIMGMTGAAWATFFAYGGMAVVLFFVARKIYPIDYEYGRLAKIALSAILVGVAFMRIPFEVFPAWVSLAIKLGLLGIFFGMMYAMKFFEPRELRMVRTMFRGSGAVREEQIDPSLDGR